MRNLWSYQARKEAPGFTGRGTRSNKFSDSACRRCSHWRSRSDDEVEFSSIAMQEYEFLHVHCPSKLSPIHLHGAIPTPDLVGPSFCICSRSQQSSSPSTCNHNAVFNSSCASSRCHYFGFHSRYAPHPHKKACAMLTSSPGGVLSISTISVPALLLAPNPLVTQQWQKIYVSGGVRIPPLAGASALSFSYLAYRWYGTLKQPKAELSGLSAFLTVLIVPYTLVFMKKLNNKLLRKAEESKGLSLDDRTIEVGLPKGESSKELLDLWATHNFVRGLFPLAGSILGLWTAIS